MKFILAAAALGAVVSAAPTAPPAKFALQISTTLDGKPIQLYLKKGANSDTTSDIKEAAACAIEGDKVICDGKSMGVAVALGNAGTDMSGFEGVNPQTQKNSISTGFSIDANNVLHFKNDAKFEPLMGWKNMKNSATFPNNEAQFAIFKSFLSGNKAKFFVNLGCTDPIHLAGHGDLHMGPVKAIAL